MTHPNASPTLIGRAASALLAATLAMASVAGVAHAEGLKDLATIQGVRGNQLIGYGLVVGLDGAGDQVGQAPFTQQSVTNMLSELGVTMRSNSNMQMKNVAACMLTMSLPVVARPGQNLHVV